MAASLAEAVELHEELRGAPPTVRPTRERVSAFVERWSEVRAGRLAPSTRGKYETALAHVCQGLGTCYVDGLTPSEIRAWQAKERGREWAPQTVNTWLRALRVVLEDAVEDGVLKSNPARAVKTLPETDEG